MADPGGNPNWTIMVYIAADDVLSDFAVGSLQQLKHLAGEDSDVVVAAQFDANGKQEILRLIFEGKADQGKSIDDGPPARVSPVDMAEPEALREFIDWAYQQRKAPHYCLVLWGHGPELLTGDHPNLADGQKAKKFLTPSDVREAVAGTRLIEDGCKFDIVAIDACNMSMVELACELRKYAEFMVASQEEVPDFSFPYDKLLTLGPAKVRDEIAGVCREIPGRYIAAYRDFILTKATQTKSITLSSLSLKDVGAVTNLLGQLAHACMAADEATRRAIIEARANSKDFVLGLYVDVLDFCEQVLFRKNVAPEIRSICDQLRRAIQPGRENALVLANEVAEDFGSAVPQNRRCHGISVYYSFLNYSANTHADENVRGIGMRDRSDAGNRSYPQGTRGITSSTSTADIGAPVPRGMATGTRGGPDVLSRGGPDVRPRGGPDVLSKGGPDVLSKGGPDVLSKMRRQRIEETEQYYAGLEFSKETQWDKFIRHCWSRWLVEDVEAKLKLTPEADLSEALNQHYSAQQCALNLLSLCREFEANGTPGKISADDRDAGNNNQQKRVPADVLTR